MMSPIVGGYRDRGLAAPRERRGRRYPSWLRGTRLGIGLAFLLLACSFPKLDRDDAGRDDASTPSIPDAANPDGGRIDAGDVDASDLDARAPDATNPLQRKWNPGHYYALGGDTFNDTLWTAVLGELAATPIFQGVILR